MNILRFRAAKILNFKRARSLLSTLLVCAASALLFTSSLKLGGVGTNDSKDRRIFSDLSQILRVCYLGNHVFLGTRIDRKITARDVLNWRVAPARLFRAPRAKNILLRSSLTRGIGTKSSTLTRMPRKISCHKG